MGVGTEKGEAEDVICASVDERCGYGLMEGMMCRHHVP